MPAWSIGRGGTPSHSRSPMRSSVISHWRGQALWRPVMRLPIAHAMSSAAGRRQNILDGISRAAELARRDPAGIALIAISKGRTAHEIEELIAAGQRDFGENRVQEAQ